MAFAERALTKERFLSGFFRLLEIQANEASDYPNALDRMMSGELQAVVLHGVYDPELLHAIVQRLESHDPPFLQTWFPDAFQSWFFGQNLNLAHPDLVEYFAESTIFREQLRLLFPTGTGFDDYVAPLLSRLDHGRPFVAPPGPATGQQYMFTTFRAHLPGGFIPPHYDNEQALRPSYRHLMGLIEPHLLSFVLAFTLPDQGGALQIFNRRSAPLADVLSNDDRVLSDSSDGISGCASVSLRIPAGSLILVDSGQYLHRVTPVIGSRKRWTACSFLARSRHEKAVYCWG